ncbi:hypothetical protein CLOM_g24036 [Closterium sp. NIES-68]|nr:hypothetical protein CLOM_g24036 [Closterium sp. NIES-68]GJP67317.1 hypothetical protein CLOP_g24148 [Closterium sp. NIES-67]
MQRTSSRQHIDQSPDYPLASDPIRLEEGSAGSASAGGGGGGSDGSGDVGAPLHSPQRRAPPLMQQMRLQASLFLRRLLHPRAFLGTKCAAVALLLLLLTGICAALAGAGGAWGPRADWVVAVEARGGGLPGEVLLAVGDSNGCDSNERVTVPLPGDGDGSSAEGESGAMVFLSIGDFGNANDSQKAVAAQMGTVAEAAGARFVVTVGDNVYDNGVTGEADPLFEKVFEGVYTHPALQVRWYMSLGDHDNKGSVAAQIAHSHTSSKWYLPAPYYSLSLPLPRTHSARPAATAGEESAGQGGGEAAAGEGGGAGGNGSGVEGSSSGGNGSDSGGTTDHIDFFFTNSIGLEGVLGASNDNDRRFFSNYSLDLVGPQAGRQQLKWLEAQLERSTARWKVVVGHRPIITAGVRPRFPAEPRFSSLLLPLLHKHHVDVYLFGHDHVAQHLERCGVVHVGNGVGGYKRHWVHPTGDTVWADSSFFGFIKHAATRDWLDFTFIAANGTTMHSFRLPHRSLRPHPSAPLSTPLSPGFPSLPRSHSRRMQLDAQEIGEEVQGGKGRVGL